MSRTELPEVAGILVIDKPQALTSHDVVARVRRLTGMKRVGHGGTLDPFATGVLPVAVGSATRILHYLQSDTKGYLAHLVLGLETDSGDCEGSIIARSAEDAWPEIEDVHRAARAFVGTIEQVPPALSAIKVGGQPLHRRVRAGELVEVPSRMVTIHSIEVRVYDPPDLVIGVVCGSGTYIRSLARDLGRSLGCLAYCHGLRRTNVGPFCLGDAWTLDELQTRDVRDGWAALALGTDAAVREMPACLLGEESSLKWYHGRSQTIAVPGVLDSACLVRAYDPHGRFAGVGQLDEAGNLAPRLVLPQPSEVVDG